MLLPKTWAPPANSSDLWLSTRNVPNEQMQNTAVMKVFKADLTSLVEKHDSNMCNISNM